MSINFATLQALDIPEGKVVEIKDALGRVIWAVQNSKPVVLQVAKVTSDTYAGETTYTGEQFILLDIYPKTNGTVKVTYGGLTKTIKDTSGAESPNSQQVFFGTFNGVSDSVTTPASGELTIEGDYVNWGSGQYQVSTKGTDISYGGGITSVVDWGSLEHIGTSAFRGCKNLTQMFIPDGIKSIGNYAFHGCAALTSITIPDSVTSIGGSAFYNCTSLTSITIPDNVTSIGNNAFYDCESLASISSIRCATIGDYAFYGCYALTSIPLAEGVVSIGTYAFCLGNEQEVFNNAPMYKGMVEIPSTVKNIGEYAFTTTTQDGEYYNSSYLYTVKFLSATPPVFGGAGKFENAFGDFDSSNRTVIVPAESVEVYKATIRYQSFLTVKGV